MAGGVIRPQDLNLRSKGNRSAAAPTRTASQAFLARQAAGQKRLEAEQNRKKSKGSSIGTTSNYSSLAKEIINKKRKYTDTTGNLTGRYRVGGNNTGFKRAEDNPNVIAPKSTVLRGNEGEAVRRKLGFKRQVSNAEFKQRVREYQKRHNLTVDGIVGEQTLNAMGIRSGSLAK